MPAGLRKGGCVQIRVMKILWLSNALLTGDDGTSSGTWLGATAKRLVASGQVSLANITVGSVDRMNRRDHGGISQWIIPAENPSRKTGLPPKAVVAEVLRAVDEFNPDIVHVWGTESFWGLLTARRMIMKPALLETQGIKTAIAKVFAGGLSWKEQMACAGIRELVRRKTIPQMQRSFQEWGVFEHEIIRDHPAIVVQTDWLESQVRSVAGIARIFRNDFILREPFYTAPSWQRREDPVLFCTAAYSAPFKGLHVAVRAGALLKKRFPRVELRIAGAHQRKGLLKDGYIAWIDREARRLGMSGQIRWLGPMSAYQIAQELLACAAFVMPSYVEGYCLGLAEAMAIGAPSVVSFAGGAACLAQDGVSALYFPPGDDKMCAWQIERILTDRGLAEHLSANARSIAQLRNNPAVLVGKLLEIYRTIVRQKSPHDGLA